MFSELLLFAKKMKFMIKGGMQFYVQVFPWRFCFMRGHSLVELTEYDNSAAGIIHIHNAYR